MKTSPEIMIDIYKIFDREDFNMVSRVSCLSTMLCLELSQMKLTEAELDEFIAMFKPQVADIIAISENKQPE